MSNTSHISPFEVIRRVSDNGIEYWSARDLYKLLGYSSWQKFQFALDQAKKACENSGQAVSEHFNLQVKMVQLGFGGQRKTEDHHLSRYACYLIIQNADSSKPIVALGQTYFAVQTRRQELADELAALPEDQKRLILRSEMAIFNAQLAETAQQAGVDRRTTTQPRSLLLDQGSRADAHARHIGYGIIGTRRQGPNDDPQLSRSHFRSPSVLSTINFIPYRSAYWLQVIRVLISRRKFSGGVFPARLILFMRSNSGSGVDM